MRRAAEQAASEFARFSVEWVEVSAPAPSCGGGQGWGVARTCETSAVAFLLVELRDAPPWSSPATGEETQRDDSCQSAPGRAD